MTATMDILEPITKDAVTPKAQADLYVGYRILRTASYHLDIHGNEDDAKAVLTLARQQLVREMPCAMLSIAHRMHDRDLDRLNDYYFN